ncbi:MAG: choice-of-anchor I family protein [Hyphomicrobiaceae bacterium]|nr:choice-of-anchor I family protein [Hyphomicrobiaceae bacterium]
MALTTTPTNNLTLAALATIGSTDGIVGAEISAYDAASQRLFVTSGAGLQIVDLSDPTAPAFVSIIDFTLAPYGANSTNVSSVASSGGLIAVSLLNADKTVPGEVVFFNAADGSFVRKATVGNHPDMVTFTPDGTKLLVANEGELTTTNQDSPGSVSIIDVATGVVTPVSFTGFDGQETSLRAEGVRIAAGVSASNDLEPEYISISPDGTKAFVTLQENNAVAIVDIATGTVDDIVGLGLQDYSSLMADFSDRDGPTGGQSVELTTGNPVFGFFMPDAIASYSSNGQTYYVIANEGDDRNDFLPAEETDRIGDLTLDPIAFPNAAALQEDAVLGRLEVFTNAGDEGNDGDYEQLITLGGRSFSILDSTGARVFDSADILERVFAATPGTFTDGTALDDSRSDAKGPEPEGVTVQVINGRTYAFVGLERGQGGVMAFDVTDPTDVTFSSYAFTLGDLQPEGLTFIKATDSPTGSDLLVVTNEGTDSPTDDTITIYEAQSFDLQVTEIWPGQAGSDVTADWFEITNFGNVAWSAELHGGLYYDDVMPSAAEADLVFGITQIAPGESVIVTLGTVSSAEQFRDVWSEVVDLDQIEVGYVDGSGLGDGGDEVNLWVGNPQESGILVDSEAYPDTAANNAASYDVDLGAFSTVGNGSGAVATQALGGSGADTPAVASPGTTASTQPFTLQLLHFADAEAGLLASDTAPLLAALVDGFDDDYANTLILAGGDNFIPGPFLAAGTDVSVRDELNASSGSTITSSTLPIAGVDIAIHNVIGVEASTVGNHEFDLGTRVFADAIRPGSTAGWVGAEFPYLSANLDFSADADISGRFEQTVGDSDLELASTLNGRIVPSAIVEKGGEQIGLVGVTTQILSAISSTGNVSVIGPDQNDMPALAAILQPVIDDLRDQGVNKIVLMAHLQQIQLEQALAPLLDGVDIILAAGSNTRLGDADDEAVAFPGHAADFAGTYPIVVNQPDGETTLIVNTDNEFTYLGRLVVDFDDNGDIILDSLDTSINGAYAATVDNVAEAWDIDPDTVATIEDIQATAAFADGTKGDLVRDMTDAVDAVISLKDGNTPGFTSVYLEGERAIVRTQETNLGNLSADANAYALRQALGDAGEDVFVVSLKNGGGIRSVIGSVDVATGEKEPTLANPDAGKVEGDISVLDVENSLRFNNRLVAFDVTAENLKAILEHGVAASGPGQTPGQFPQIGGIAFSWDPAGTARSNDGTTPGTRVQNVALIGEDGSKTPLYVDGVLVDGAPTTITVVTLNFLAATNPSSALGLGGDNYPMNQLGTNFRVLLNDGTLQSVSDPAQLAAGSLPSNALGEQQAFIDYVAEFFPDAANAYDEADTPASGDRRIQNLDAVAEDTVLDASFEGGAGDETFVGGIGNDVIDGGAGNDNLQGGEGNDSILGGLGNDLIVGGDGNDTMNGGTGNDRLFGGIGNDRGDGGIGNDVLRGEAGNDTLFGGSGNDVMVGGTGNDRLDGGAGNDLLLGEAGSDVLTGGTGRDVMSGGSQRDIFDFNSIFDSRGALRDRITDFQRLVDDIDLRTIDANTRQGGDQRFAFIGDDTFSGRAGELHYVRTGSGVRVEGDVNGDGRADFAIDVTGVASLSAGDFLL